jgi:hypothetical protein
MTRIRAAGQAGDAPMMLPLPFEKARSHAVVRCGLGAIERRHLAAGVSTDLARDLPMESLSN